MAALDRKLTVTPPQSRMKLPPDPSSTKVHLDEEFAPATVRQQGSRFQSECHKF